MKYLQSFSVFESQTSATLTAEQKEFLNQYTKGTWSVNPSTGLVDVQGSFDCSSRKFESLVGIRFGMVTGNFSCAYNQLTNLEGAPQTVTGDFYCNDNKLTTLEGAPQTVTGDFYCVFNQLTTLEGAPQTVEGDFYCYSNQLTNLEGAPRTVEGDFLCHDNKLTTLEGAPQTVGGDFFCSYNQLTNLEGAPQTVEGIFSCHTNQLTTLVGAPRTVEGGFRCDAFKLELGEWNPTGWLQVLRTGSTHAKRLILTLPYLQPDWWNLELSKDPARTIQLLAQVWCQMSDDLKRGIRIPPGYEDRLGMRSEFSDLGLF